MREKIELAKALLESNGYTVLTEADAEELRARMRQEAEKSAEKSKVPTSSQAKRLLSQIKQSRDRLQTAFDLLVPQSGSADTLAGELVRAMMRLMYRDYNDGDVFYDGYGVETCAPAAAFLIKKIPAFGTEFESAAMRVLVDDDYTSFLEGVSEELMDLIVENPKYLLTSNTEDMHDTDISGIEELIPDYDYDIVLPYELQMHIEVGNISRDQLRYELSTWEILRDADRIELYNDFLNVIGISKDEYEELDYSLAANLDMYAEELTAEFGDPEEEDYEEEDY